MSKKLEKGGHIWNTDKENANNYTDYSTSL